MKSLAAVVPKGEGEEARRRLDEAGVLRRDRRIRERDGFLLIPLTERVSEGYPIETVELPAQGVRPRNYRQTVAVPDEFRSLLPRSYDVIGHVVVIRLADELRPFASEIGAGLLRFHEGAETVAVDEGVQGPYRQRGIRVVAGKEDTRTLHKEFGLTLALDPAKVHFSPRMATERRRVAKAIQAPEVVVDAFSGVGPFALHACRAGARRVYAVDANPEAVAFLRENVRRNRADAVVPLAGPIEEVLPDFEPADRFILDYPWEPLPYVPLAAGALKENGVLHYYEILDRTEREERFETLEATLPKGRTLEVQAVREVRGYSPTQVHYAFDLRIGRG